MMSIETFRKMALSFPGTTEQPHFNKTSFRVNKKIFATLDVQDRKACIKLSETDQDVFCLFDSSVIFPVPGKWGMQGWTLMDLRKVRKDMCLDALATAYSQVAPAKFASEVKSKNKHI